MPRRLTEGLPDARIAERLSLSPYTLKARPDSIYGESGVASRSPPPTSSSSTTSLERPLLG